MGQPFFNIVIKQIILDTRTTEEVKTVDKVDYFCAIFTEFLRGKPTDDTAKWCLRMHDLARVVPHIAFQNPDGLKRFPKLCDLPWNRQIDDLDILCSKLACERMDAFHRA